MSEDQFTKLFKYMTKRFDEIDKTLATKANSKDLQTALGYLMHLQKARVIATAIQISCF